MICTQKVRLCNDFGEIKLYWHKFLYIICLISVQIIIFLALFFFGLGGGVFSVRALLLLSLAVMRVTLNSSSMSKEFWLLDGIFNYNFVTINSGLNKMATQLK